MPVCPMISRPTLVWESWKAGRRCMNLAVSSQSRHRLTDIRDTLNRFATSWSLAPASISSATASHTAPGGPVLQRSARRHRRISWFRHNR
jgi:hypothetical protein